MSQSLRTLSVLLVCALLASACTSVKPRTATPTLQNETVSPVDVDAYADKYPGEDGVFLQHAVTHEHVSNSIGWEYFSFTERRYLILNTDNESLSTFELTVDEGERLRTLQLVVVSPDGETQAFGTNDMNVERDQGSATYKIAYPNIETGSVVQEVFEVSKKAGYKMSGEFKNTPPRYTDVGLRYAYPTEQLSYRYIHPDFWDVQVKRIGEGQEPPLKVIRNPEASEIRRVYEATDVRSARTDEPFSPFYKEMAPYATIQITRQDTGGFPIEPSWELLAGYFEDFAVNDQDGFFSTALERKADDLEIDGDSVEEQVRAILGYIYDDIDIRNSSDSEDFADVIKNGHGNAYQVNGLAQALLAEYKLDSQYILVHSAQNGYFDREFITAREIQIPGLRIRVGGEKLYAFPILKNLPLDLMPQILQGQPAVVLGADTPNPIITLPERTGREDNVTTVNYTLTIDEDGVLTVEEERVLRGAKGYVVRQSLQNKTDEEIQEELKELLTYSDGEVEWINREVVNQDNFREPLRVKLAYTIDNLVTLTPEEILFQTSGLFSPLSGSTYKVDVSERQNPVRIYYTQTEEKTIEINFPDAWSLTTDVETVAFENRFGAIEGRFESGPGQLKAIQSTTLQRSQDGPDGYSDLLRLVGTESDLQIPTLIFQVGDEAAASEMDDTGQPESGAGER